MIAQAGPSPIRKQGRYLERMYKWLEAGGDGVDPGLPIVRDLEAPLLLTSASSSAEIRPSRSVGRAGQRQGRARVRRAGGIRVPQAAGVMDMNDWIEIGRLEQVPVTRRALCSTRQPARSRCSALLDIQAYAIENSPPHKGGPLSEGIAAWRLGDLPAAQLVFDLAIGEARRAPTRAGQDLAVNVDRWPHLHGGRGCADGGGVSPLLVGVRLARRGAAYIVGAVRRGGVPPGARAQHGRSSATVRTTCPYCGVGCGVLATSPPDGSVTNRRRSRASGQLRPPVLEGLGAGRDAVAGGPAALPRDRRRAGELGPGARPRRRQASAEDASPSMDRTRLPFYGPGSCSPRTTTSPTS